jgi:hypothetical protein
MNADHPLVALDIAFAKQDDARRNAALARLTSLAREDRVAEPHRLRRMFGMALIRLGQSLQGGRPRRLPSDLAAAAGVLHIAR